MKALCTNSPQYLDSHIRYHQPVRSLRSSDQQFLVSTPSSTNFGSHSFRSAAPVIWNSLPLAIRTSATIDTFKRCLITLLLLPSCLGQISPCIRFIHDVLHVNIYLHFTFTFFLYWKLTLRNLKCMNKWLCSATALYVTDYVKIFLVYFGWWGMHPQYPQWCIRACHRLPSIIPIWRLHAKEY